MDRIYFCRRKLDGKYYRGSRLWKWCRSWRRAAALDRAFWNEFVLYKIKHPVEFVTLEKAIKYEEKKK